MPKELNSLKPLGSELSKEIPYKPPFIAEMEARDSQEDVQEIKKKDKFMFVILILFLALALSGMIGGIFGLAWWKVMLIGVGIVILGAMFG